MKKKLISIGVICFNEELNVAPAYKELVEVTNKNKNYNYDFIFVDNGSTDNTREEIRKITKKDKGVAGIFLSRNFGNEASIQASLDYAQGDAYVCFEGDLQDPANIILSFIKEWERGFDVVVGIRTKIADTFLMTKIRKLYYRIFRSISNIEVPVDAGSFALLDKKVMNAIKKLPEKHRFNRGLRAWVGFKTTYVNYHRRPRQRGKSSYNLLGYIHHAEKSFYGFSYLPLDIIVYTGLLIVTLSFLFVIIYLFSFILFGQKIEVSKLIIFSIVLFGGIQLLALSIIGKYIQVIVEETKARPVYIVEEIVKNSFLDKK
ncbi:glycosyltransferase family 2 protein [Candidatus Daviesbacteria bacterium]|nr:glycosyltransferase family 2 protein [Candidatus Daviesbacteria bacterium]